MRSYSDLPEEIVLAVLSQVPVKSVGLCRCVSKPWRALLSQPKFIKTHLQVSKTNPQESLVIFRYSQQSSEIYSAPLNNAPLFDEITLSLTKLSFADHPDPWFRVYGSCDGLLLVSDTQSNMFVVNPVTREIRQVSSLPFAFDPDLRFSLYGFGYDSVSDDYKMVSFSYFCTWLDDNYISTETFVDVCSLKSGSWRRVGSSPYDHADASKASSAFVGGCLHWLARTDFGSVIVAFDLVEEKFREVPPPSLIISHQFVDHCQLGVLGGCLCVFYAEMNKEVWVMNEYGVAESWTKFTVNDPNGCFECSLSTQEQVVLMFEDDKRVMWNLKQGTLKEIVINGSSAILHVKASFVESLVSPHGSNESERE